MEGGSKIQYEPMDIPADGSGGKSAKGAKGGKGRKRYVDIEDVL